MSGIRTCRAARRGWTRAACAPAWSCACARADEAARRRTWIARFERATQHVRTMSATIERDCPSVRLSARAARIHILRDSSCAIRCHDALSTVLRPLHVDAGGHGHNHGACRAAPILRAQGRYTPSDNGDSKLDAMIKSSCKKIDAKTRNWCGSVRPARRWSCTTPGGFMTLRSPSGKGAKFDSSRRSQRSRSPFRSAAGA